MQWRGTNRVPRLPRRALPLLHFLRRALPLLRLLRRALRLRRLLRRALRLRRLLRERSGCGASWAGVPRASCGGRSRCGASCGGRSRCCTCCGGRSGCCASRGGRSCRYAPRRRRASRSSGGDLDGARTRSRPCLAARSAIRSGPAPPAPAVPRFGCRSCCQDGRFSHRHKSRTRAARRRARRS